MDKHRSGSLAAWKLRRETYQKTQGPVSNPGDGRERKKVRRLSRRLGQRILDRVAP